MKNTEELISFSYKDLLPLQEKINEWLDTYDKVENKVALDRSYFDKKQKMELLLITLADLITQKYAVKIYTSDLDKIKAALEAKIAKINTTYKALKFNAAKNLSISAGSSDEKLFNTVKTNLDTFFDIEFKDYFKACGKARPSDIQQRVIWGKKIKKEWIPKLEKIKKAHNFILHAATNLKGTDTNKSYRDITSDINTVKSNWDKKVNKLEQLNQTGTISAIQKDEIIELKTVIKRMNGYQDDLMELIGNKEVQVKLDPSIPFNDVIMDGGVLTVRVKVLGEKHMVAHEMQHLIQISKGQLGVLNDGSGTVNFLYDMNDEVEAYQVQYLLKPNSVPGAELLRGGIGTGASKNGPIFIRKYADINIKAIQKMVSQEKISAYANLPSDKYSINNTLEKLNSHPKETTDFLKLAMKDVLKNAKIKEMNLFFEQMWNLNKTRKLTESFVSVSYGKDRVPLKNKETGGYIFRENSTTTILKFYKDYFKFSCK